ncbi:P44/Msp2 family outer membrane protein [Ehrlichia ruminantium]|uniref:P44/Msp2 family outer membrane protein n=1 Tax=Ehrlichia ruminantium TaxID=779 RepID=A0AAE6QBE1_EHRRU|nr:P44/Msp2 family outer membrane protein [Ehrlichia ruminantium]QGR02934.1 P44/Msp2 family outer membrane protein [Ehrlichia ruminantium]QGR03858.1 P44/Msp2 family outer membrane protein [Ehrlichia ruminantium]QGR04785.1 P44/Msp2 family outer membrane protein [Ehrlichia ruminantium]
MKDKLTFINTLLTLVLFVPNISCAEMSNIYFSGQYKPAIPTFKNFSITEKDNNIGLLIALTSDINNTNINNNDRISSPKHFITPYHAQFQNSIISFSSTIGQYLPKNLRVEIEGSYKSFDVKNPGYYNVNDAYRYFALARNVEKNSYQPQSNKKNNTSDLAYYTIMKNYGISVMSVFLNGCYDISRDKLKASPYICLGIGADTIEFFETLHIKFAYQCKVGISYLILPKVNLFADGYYHKVKNNQFKNLNTIQVRTLANNPKVTYAAATLDINYFGAEIGARFTF